MAIWEIRKLLDVGEAHSQVALHMVTVSDPRGPGPVVDHEHAIYKSI